ncbi:RNA 2'-phosphotransferase [Pseudobacteroides cellulosolvens]|uniref:Probable RNA 2'-phosphotransferase n=1 Tax=Pseudobacteroides cellulosolvens ATCC 35603 = DSM 2933 TaxID=398512 RepID=A0A0L6JHE4_9FIRM|nr:RNA 2'-phosphotransferase [Pseudobacteroides cellulosolvens]KNY25144.1 RNA 2'-phosphotransferase [Pseudobacteroides cellulosolvens ATCC 35603 = DSM 2933]
MNYVGLSKEISYALRHAPWEYELELDENGAVDVQQLIDSLREDTKWQFVTIKDILKSMELSDKKRFEIKDGKIRALYGHSIPQKLIKEPQEPPEILYHGTARRFVESIMKDGLLPRGRQYVHLSSDTATASIVGKRRDSSPVLLKIYAKKAWDDGAKFYYGNETIWLADNVDSKYIED